MQNMAQLFLTAPYPHANLWMRVKYPRNRNSNMEKTMRDSKFGLRAFGLALVAALGLMAFMAVGAQAEETLEDGGKAGKFLVNKAAPTTGATSTFEVNQVAGTTGTLLVPGRVDILCTGGKVTGEFKSSTEALGSAKFTGCTAWSPVTTFPHATQIKTCTVSTKKEGAGGEKEVVVVEKAIALSKLHNGEPYILLEEDGAAFTTIFFEGKECSLTPENKVTGSVVGKIDGNDTVNPTVLLSQAIQKLFQIENKETKVIKGDQLKFGTFQAYIDAEGIATGTGVNASKTLGVC